jgi:acyl-CoA synthetase (AMP-forming)/AMP-acid ligase II
VFFNLLNKSSNAIAAIEADQQLSYAQLAAKCADFANRLAGPRQLIFLKAHNNIDTLIAYLAALSGEHPLMLLNPAIAEDKLTRLIALYQPNLMIENFNVTRLNDKTLNLAQDLSLLLSTSGSTGSAKQVALSAANLQANAQSICDFLPIENTDRTITTLPFFYSYGLSVINSHLLVGATIVFSDYSFVNREFWQLFNEHKISSFAGVPHSYDMLLRLRFERMQLPSLRYFTQAGGKLAGDKVQQLAQYAQQNEKQFFVMYGQTEATARMSYLPSELALRKPDSIGRAIPGGELTLQNAQGDEVIESNVSAELVYQGANVMLGYAEMSSDLSEFPPKAKLLTGDIAYRDLDGDFNITGRKKRFIKLVGQRLNLDEVENLLREKNLETYCCGDDNRLIVAVLKSTNKNNDNKALKQLISTILQLHHSLLCILHIDQPPLTANGKKDYQAVMTMAESAEAKHG